MSRHDTLQPNDPAWLREAFYDLGLKEIVGKRHEGKVLEMYRKAGHPEIDNDETAWCAAAVGSWLHDAGFKNTGSLMARSYEKYGRKLNKRDTLPRGAICVWPRGNPPSGHVDICLYDDGEYIVCIGGNVSNMVKVYTQRKRDLVAAVWPTDAPLTKKKPPVVQDDEFADVGPAPQVEDVDDKPQPKKPWYKRVATYVTGGGGSIGVGGGVYALASVEDYRVAIVWATFALILIVLGAVGFGVYWKWFRKC